MPPKTPPKKTIKQIDEENKNALNATKTVECTIAVDIVCSKEDVVKYPRVNVDKPKFYMSKYECEQYLDGLVVAPPSHVRGPDYVDLYINDELVAEGETQINHYRLPVYNIKYDSDRIDPLYRPESVKVKGITSKIFLARFMKELDVTWHEEKKSLFKTTPGYYSLDNPYPDSIRVIFYYNNQPFEQTFIPEKKTVLGVDETLIDIKLQIDNTILRQIETLSRQYE